MSSVALIGNTASGKSTLFSALTGIEYIRVLAAAGKKVSASVPVLDPRFEIFQGKVGKDKKIVCPSTELFDTGPMEWKGGTCTMDKAEDIAALREMEGLILVLKTYDDADAPADDRRKKVAHDMEQVRSGLFTIDLDVMQKRIEKLKEQLKKPNVNKEADTKEMEILERLLDRVSGGDTSLFSTLTPEDEKRLRGFKFFSRKTILWLVNVADLDLSGEDPYVSSPVPGYLGRCCARLEHELAQMGVEERKEFMEGYGLERLFVANLSVKIYDALGYHMFFTLGKKDVTGWGIRKGAKALEAAGKIHSDIEKGFINAEITSYAQWLSTGGKAQHRIEGREYVMCDGDIANFKFNV